MTRRADEKDAERRGEDPYSGHHQRVDEATRRREMDRLESLIAEDEGGDDRDLVGLEEVRRHAGAVADVVADVVGNGRGIARVVFGDAGLHLADEVGAHVGSLGEDTPAHPHEQRQQRGAEAEADQHRGGCVLEDEHDRGGADQAETDAEHARDPARAEGHAQRGGQRALARRGGGTEIAAHRQAHPDDAGQTGEGGSAEEGDGAGEARLVDAHGDRAVGPLDLCCGEEHEHEQRHDHDGNRLELLAEECLGTLLDGRGDLLHCRGAAVGREDAPHEVDADREGDNTGGEREEESYLGGPAECEGLIAALARDEVGSHKSSFAWIGRKIQVRGPGFKPRACRTQRGSGSWD